MKETLQCPGILGKASYRKSLEQVYILFEYGGFPLSYGCFLSKNSSKMLSQGLNTMKET